MKTNVIQMYSQDNPEAISSLLFLNQQRNGSRPRKIFGSSGLGSHTICTAQAYARIQVLRIAFILDICGKTKEPKELRGPLKTKQL